MPGPRRVALVPFVLSAVAVLGASGCTQAPASAAVAPSVPEGVAKQYQQVNEEIRAEGGETTVGEWRVGYIVEQAEAWHQVMNDQRSFRDVAPGETHHIEIVPFEAATGRIVPDVPIRLQIVAADGRVVEDKQLVFYYGEFFHYANNFSVPEAGRYTLRARLEAPGFPRHGEHHEQPPLAEGASVEFRDVEIAP